MHTERNTNVLVYVTCLTALQELPTDEHPDHDVITPDVAELDEENARNLREKGSVSSTIYMYHTYMLLYRKARLFVAVSSGTEITTSS